MLGISDFVSFSRFFLGDWGSPSLLPYNRAIVYPIVLNNEVFYAIRVYPWIYTAHLVNEGDVIIVPSFLCWSEEERLAEEEAGYISESTAYVQAGEGLCSA